MRFMIPCCVATIVIATGLIVFAGSGERSSPMSYPGGSPFPPGQEPSLTHTINVFWTTADGIVTQIDVVAKGSRPIQTHYGEGHGGGIAPDCDIHIQLSAEKLPEVEGYGNRVIQGQGTMTVKVHGFDREAYANPPEVRVQYLRDGDVIGETSITAEPISKKILEKEPLPAAIETE